jgi:hypothetical protein
VSKKKEVSEKKEVSSKKQGKHKDMPRFNKLVAEIKAKSTKGA